MADGPRHSSRSHKRKKFDDELLGDGLVSKRAHQDRAMHTETLIKQQSKRGKKPHAVPAPLEQAPSTAEGSESPPTDWPPEDDYKLIINVQQIPDLVTIKHSVKFTRQYSLRQIKERWYLLMYDTTTCRLACAGIGMLSSEKKRLLALDNLLFSASEENELRALQPVGDETPALAAFQGLLDKHADTFAAVRTAEALCVHWSRMKSYELLSIDKSCGRLGRLIEGKSAPPANAVETVEFGVISAQLKSSARVGQSDVAVSEDPQITRKIEQELEHVDRKHKRKIRKLEHQIAFWKNLDNLGVPGTSGLGRLDSKTLAVLRSATEQFDMRSQQILLGRNTDKHKVDVDLCSGVKSSHVSRAQCIIKLKHDRHFYLTNIGQRPTYVNAQPVLRGARCRLFTNSIIEVGPVRLLFTVNEDVMRALRAEL